MACLLISCGRSTPSADLPPTGLVLHDLPVEATDCPATSKILDSEIQGGILPLEAASRHWARDRATAVTCRKRLKLVYGYAEEMRKLVSRAGESPSRVFLESSEQKQKKE